MNSRQQIFDNFVKELNNQNIDEIILIISKNLFLLEDEDIKQVFILLIDAYFRNEIGFLSDEVFKEFINIYIYIIKNDKVTLKWLDNDDDLFKFDDTYAASFPNDKIVDNGILFMNIKKIMSIKNNPDLVFRIIHHELAHISQVFNQVIACRFSYLALIMAKDECLRCIFPNYYDENYLNLANESNADYEASKVLYQIKKILNLDYYEELRISKYYLNKQENELRIIDGKEISIHNAFDKFINDVEVLNVFPILNVEYKKLNNKLVKKTPEEIIEYLSNNPEINQEFVEKIKLNIEKKASLN